MKLRALVGLTAAWVTMLPAQGGCEKKPGKEKTTMNPGNAQAARLPLRTKWRATVWGSVVAAPAAGERAVLVPTLRVGSVGSQGVVAALDRESGATAWTFGGSSGVAGGFSTRPAIAGGLAVVASGAGRVYALRLSSGEKVWDHDAGAGALAAPSVHESVVYVAGEGKQVHALELASGRVLWKAEAGGRVYSPVIVEERRIYVASEDGTIAALSGDGKPLWRVPMPATMPVSLTVGHHLLLVSALSDRSLRAVDLSARRATWSVTPSGKSEPFPERAPLCAVVGGVVCVGEGKRLLGLEPATGKRRWEMTSQADAVGLFTSGDTLVAARRNGEIQSIDPRTGSILSTRRTGGSIVSDVLFDRGVFFFTEGDGRVVAVE